MYFNSQVGRSIKYFFITVLFDVWLTECWSFYVKEKLFIPIPIRFFRLLRIGVCRQQNDQENLNKHKDGIINEPKHTKHSPKSGYNQGEDNSAYHELENFSPESQYDKLPWHTYRNPNFSVQNYVREYYAHFFLLFGSIWPAEKIL